VVAAVLAVLLIASAGVTTWLYFHQYRPDQLVDTDAQRAVLKAANDGTIALLSYSPDTLDKDFSTAKSHLTGDFLSYYTNFTQQIVTPAAKQKAVKTSAAVIRKGIAEIHPDRAVVLVFLNQVTTSKENPDGSYTTSAVKVSMERHDGTWLISAFDPV
jgi:Mce-associated membrane protein